MVDLQIFQVLGLVEGGEADSFEKAVLVFFLSDIY